MCTIAETLEIVEKRLATLYDEFADCLQLVRNANKPLVDYGSSSDDTDDDDNDICFPDLFDDHFDQVIDADFPPLVPLRRQRAIGAEATWR